MLDAALTLKINVALGGMSSESPASPYPNSGANVSVAWSPTRNFGTALSQPATTFRSPSVNSKG